MALKRRDVLGSAAALAAAVGGAASASAALAADSKPANPERNKRLLREGREASQRRALPSALPDAEPFEIQTPLGGMRPRFITIATEPVDDRARAARAKAAPARDPAAPPEGSATFISYGPMLADRDAVIEEWESYIHRGGGGIYNNQYAWIVRFEGDQAVEVREYNDSQHLGLVFSPPTQPRRRWRAGQPVTPPPASELETLFEVVDAFDLDPRLLADVVPAASFPPRKVAPGAAGAKAVVQALRKARAAGDQAAVNALHAPGFRHFIAGERPFGWDHLPLQEIYAPLVKHLASPLKVRCGPLYSDGRRVFEEMDSYARLDDGTVYNNWHAVMHEVVDGRIVQTREYMDTSHVWTVLGRWAEWGKTPAPPRKVPRRSNLQTIAMTTQTPTMQLDLERWRPFGPPAR